MKMWAKNNLGDLCSLITDGKHGDCRNEDDSGYYFISCKDIREGRIHYENARQIVHVDFGETHRRTDLRSGDVLLTNSGTIGRLAIAPDDEKTQRTTFQKSVAILKPIPERVTSHFLYYSLAADRGRLINSAGGAAQKNLLLGELRRFPIRVPPLTEQAEIASILSAYDDLIENNRRRIQLLEQAAWLLYKEWFVHLRFPGHEHVTFTDGVPEWWEKGCVGNLAEVISGYAFKSKDWQPEGNRVIKIKNIVGDGTIDISVCDRVNDNVAESASKFRIAEGTLLIAMTGATVGKVGIMPKNSKNFFLNQRVGQFRSKYYNAIENFLFPLFQGEFAQTQVQNLAGGAAQPNISGGQIESIELLIPEKKILDLYLDSTKGLFLQRQNLQGQNEKLIQARDLLLPRLMNGDVGI